MSQFIDGNTRAFTAGVAIAEHLRVKLSSGKLAIAVSGGTDEPTELGTATRAAFADGDIIAVRMRNAAGTTKMVASGAISQGALVYGTTGGKITATSTANGAAIGVALEAAGANNDVIEVLRY